MPEKETPQRVLRICVRKTTLPPEQCAVPERCETRWCQIRECRAEVHYDPKASIPALGEEFIVCGECIEAALEKEDR